MCYTKFCNRRVFSKNFYHCIFERIVGRYPLSIYRVYILQRHQTFFWSEWSFKKKSDVSEVIDSLSSWFGSLTFDFIFFAWNFFHLVREKSHRSIYQVTPLFPRYLIEYTKIPQILKNWFDSIMLMVAWLVTDLAHQPLPYNASRVIISKKRTFLIFSKVSSSILHFYTYYHTEKE